MFMLKMDIQITVSSNLKTEVLSLCNEKGAEPSTVIDVDGWDGVTAFNLIFEYGPDTFELLTAILAFWNEVKKTRDERDPIDSVKNRLIDEGWADTDNLKAIDKEIKAIVADSAEFAQTSPEPDPSELYTDVLLEA
mgnify:CR=1 FL=1